MWLLGLALAALRGRTLGLRQEPGNTTTLELRLREALDLAEQTEGQLAEAFPGFSTWCLEAVEDREGQSAAAQARAEGMRQMVLAKVTAAQGLRADLKHLEKKVTEEEEDAKKTLGLLVSAREKFEKKAAENLAANA